MGFVTRFVMPARPASRGVRGVDTVSPGMTAASCQLVAQTVPAHVFSPEDTKRTKTEKLIIRHFVRFVGKIYSLSMDAMRRQIVEGFGVVRQNFFFHSRV